MAAAWYYRSSADICRDSHFKYAAEMFWKLRQTYVGHWPVFHFEKQKEKKIYFLNSEVLVGKQ